jgi:hypothetical protein
MAEPKATRNVSKYIVVLKNGDVTQFDKKKDVAPFLETNNGQIVTVVKGKLLKIVSKTQFSIEDDLEGEDEEGTDEA